MELVNFNQWVVWKTDYVEDRLTKIPVCPTSQLHASSTDEDTWSDYKTAVKTWHSRPHLYKGVGFVFTDSDPFCVIDIDNIEQCESEIQTLPNKFNTYQEISQSGKGIHIIMKAHKPGNKCRSKEHPGLEIYDKNRFMAITGNGDKVEIADCQELLTETYNKFFPQKEQNAVRKEILTESDLTDDQIIEIAKNSKNGAVFKELWEGGDLWGDKSANDLALCNILAFYCQGDTAKMDRLFRQSGLMREKWERDDYRRRTLDKAVEDCSEFYSPKTKIKITGDYDPDDVAKAFDSEKSSWVVPNVISAFNDIGNADYFSRKYEDKLLFNNDNWYEYDGMKWKNIKEPLEQAKTVSEDLKLLFANIEDTKLKATALKWANQTGNLNHIKAMMQIAETDERLCYKGEMDNYINSINCKNGVVDLSTGKLTPHNPQFKWSKICNVNYNSDADIPVLWLGLIKKIANTPEWENWLQRALGYSLTANTDEQCCFWCYGEGSTGKSTLLETVANILGSFAKSFNSNMFMQGSNYDFELVGLQGYRFVYSEESCSKKELDSASFKAVTGGGVLECKRKYKEAVNVKFTNKAWFATNEMPKFTPDEATKRRLRFIPFTKEFKKENKDLKYQMKMISEWEGIFAWLVRGAMDYYKSGVGELDEQVLIKENQIIENDLLYQWFYDTFDKAPESCIPSSDLWKWWCNYCESTNNYNYFKRSNDFIIKLNKIAKTKSTKKSGDRVVIGLKLKGNS